MPATFRNDLSCSREESQGVVFYRLDDAETKTSFRLYEIEYLIAQKLDGQRTLAQVIEAVKAEFNFDITEGDLQKFISQLESMGFVRQDTDAGAPMPVAAAAPAAIALDSTGEMSAPLPPSAEPEAEAATQSQAARPSPAAAPPHNETVELEVAPPPVDQGELGRLLKTAFMQVRQGLLIHARDYLLAAREVSPDDPKLIRLISSIEVVGDEASREDLAGIWQQCCELAADVADSLGPLTSPGSQQAVAAVAAAAVRSNRAWYRDLRARVGLTATLLVLFVAGGGGLAWAVLSRHLFEAPAKVRTTSLEGARVPVFYAGTAAAVRAQQDAWITFSAAGALADTVVRPGTRVKQGDLLASIALPGHQGDQVEGAGQAVARAEAELTRADRGLAKTADERQAAEAERDELDEKMRALRPRLVLKDRAAKGALKAAKKDLQKVRRKLVALARRERAPRAAQARAKKRLEQSQQRLEQLQASLGDKLLRAPFAGEVVAVKVTAGQQVAPQTPVVQLRNATGVHLSFPVADAAALQPGTAVAVSVQRGSPVAAKVVRIDAAKGGPQVVVELPDSTATFLSMAPDAFRLVHEYADQAFRVRPKSILGDEHHASVLVVVQGHVTRQPVQVLEAQQGDMLIRDPSGHLHNDMQVVLDRYDGQSLVSLDDGAEVVAAEAK